MMVVSDLSPLLQEADLLEEYEVVKLTAALSGSPIPVGARGTVLMVYMPPRLAYEIELLSKTGQSFGFVTVEAAQVAKWQPPVMATGQGES